MMPLSTTKEIALGILRAEGEMTHAQREYAAVAIESFDSLLQTTTEKCDDWEKSAIERSRGIFELREAIQRLTAGLKYLTREQIMAADPKATAILDVPCGAVQNALEVLDAWEGE